MPTPAELMLLKNKLSANSLLQSVLRSAKKRGHLDLYVTGVEKYNHQIWDDDGNELPEKVKAPGGSYDVEGHSWTDVYGFYDVRWWHPGDLLKVCRWMVRWFRELTEFKSFEYSWNTFPLFPPYSNWVWAPASMRCAARDAADKQRLDTLFDNGAKPTEQELRQAIKEVDVLADQLLLDLSKLDQLLVADGYVKLQIFDVSFWISPEDPTCFYCDAPFDLKDGWSDAKVGEIIDDWCLALWSEECLDVPPLATTRLVSENRVHLHERIAHVAKTYKR